VSADSWKAIPSGIVSLEAKSFRLQCYQTLTGLKFFVTAAPIKTGAAAGGKSLYSSPAPGVGGGAGSAGPSGAAGLDVATAKPLAASSNKVNLDQFLHTVYRLYTDYGTGSPVLFFAPSFSKRLCLFAVLCTQSLRIRSMSWTCPFATTNSSTPTSSVLWRVCPHKSDEPLPAHMHAPPALLPLTFQRTAFFFFE
jgi:hypothetical protein